MRDFIACKLFAQEYLALEKASANVDTGREENSFKNLKEKLATLSAHFRPPLTCAFDAHVPGGGVVLAEISKI